MAIMMEKRHKIPVAMTIAGSDSGGGAGIEADLKTFAALRVHGTVALTAITAQNTYEVTAIQEVDPGVVAKQIEAVWSDMGIDAAKTGMLYNSEIIRVVAREVEKAGFPLVVDPVMVAKSGALLLREEAVKALREELLPKATVVTPNAREAEVLTGLKVSSIEDMRKAARAISELGARAVVVKGGHAGPADESVDVLLYDGRFIELRAPRIASRSTHGTGCSFSAAITAFIARGLPIEEAVRRAKEFITVAIMFGLDIGRGHGPVNPMAYVYRDVERLEALLDVEEAARILEDNPSVAKLVPEVGMNVARATPYSLTPTDVAAIPGRLVKTARGVRRAACPEFGASSHLARYILEVRKRGGSDKLAAINIRMDERFLEKLRGMGLVISGYDRRLEPPHLKEREGATIPWGVGEALRGVDSIPDVIYHTGDWGKEPMIIILGRTAVEVARLVVELAEKA